MKRIIAGIIAALAIFGAAAGTAHASTPHTLYRGSAPITSTLYRG